MSINQAPGTGGLIGRVSDIAHNLSDVETANDRRYQELREDVDYLATVLGVEAPSRQPKPALIDSKR